MEFAAGEEGGPLRPYDKSSFPYCAAQRNMAIAWIGHMLEAPERSRDGRGRSGWAARTSEIAPIPAVLSGTDGRGGVDSRAEGCKC